MLIADFGVGFIADASDERVERGLTGVGELSCTAIGLRWRGVLDILGGVLFRGMDG